MNLDSDLARDLERAIPHLPTGPATAHLTTGRRALRRRRAYVGIAGVAAAAVIGGAALSAGGAPSADPAPPAATDTPSRGVADIPDWAEEYGNHGAVSIYPNGELWVAPDARLIRSVEIAPESFQRTVVSAYAAEAEIDGEVSWTFVFRTSRHVDDRPAGFMEPAGEWTTDFELWTDYATADMQGRTRFSERMVRFADDSSSRLVAREGAQIVEQVVDVDLGPAWQGHPRTSIAEVTYAGRTWFVVANGPRSGDAFYTAYQAEVTSASDIGGFLDYLHDRA